MASLAKAIKKLRGCGLSLLFLFAITLNAAWFFRRRAHLAQVQL